MDFFSLPCTTCKTVLKVRSAAIVGKILSCPKCGGMVLVKPPADWEPGKAGVPEGPSTITATPPSWSDDSFSKPNRDPVKDFEEIDHLLGSPKAPAVAPAPTSSPPLAKPTAPAPVAKEPAPTKSNPVAAPVAKPPAVTTEPPAEKPLANKLPEKKTVAAAAAAVIAPTVAAAAIPPPKPATAYENAPIPPAPVSASLPPPADWSADRPWRHWLLVGASGVAGVLLAIGVVAFSIRMMRANRPQPAISTVLPAPATEEVQPLEPTADPPPTTTVEPPPAVAEEKPVPPPQDPVVENPPPPKPADPLELTKPEEKPRPGRVFAGLDKFDAILNNSVKPETAPAEDPAAAPLPMDTPEKPLTSLPRPQPRKTNVAARLADPLPKIEADGVALVDFLQLMSDLSTIPITLEPEGLAMAGAAPNSAVKFQASATTVGQALAEGLKSVHLEFFVNDKGVVVSASKTPRPIAVPLNDLVGGDPAGPVGLLNLVLDTGAPGVWNETTGELRHEPAVLWRVVDLTERLRVARGVPQKSKFDPKLFRQQTRTERVREKLATPVTLNFVTPTPLTRVLDRLGRAAGMRLLVDWRSLEEVGWNPDGEALLAVDKAAFGEALDDLLTPMELTWRVIDDQTIQILSPAALAAQPELEIHKLPVDVADADSAARLISALRRELGEDAFQDHGGCQLKYDAAAKSLIAVLPQDKQRRLSNALADPNK